MFALFPLSNISRQLPKQAPMFGVSKVGYALAHLNGACDLYLRGRWGFPLPPGAPPTLEDQYSLVSQAVDRMVAAGGEYLPPEEVIRFRLTEGDLVNRAGAVLRLLAAAHQTVCEAVARDYAEQWALLPSRRGPLEMFRRQDGPLVAALDEKWSSFLREMEDPFYRFGLSPIGGEGRKMKGLEEVMAFSSMNAELQAFFLRGTAELCDLTPDMWQLASRLAHRYLRVLGAEYFPPMDEEFFQRISPWLPIPSATVCVEYYQLVGIFVVGEFEEKKVAKRLDWLRGRETNETLLGGVERLISDIESATTLAALIHLLEITPLPFESKKRQNLVLPLREIYEKLQDSPPFDPEARRELASLLEQVSPAFGLRRKTMSLAGFPGERGGANLHDLHDEELVFLRGEVARLRAEARGRKGP